MLKIANSICKYKLSLYICTNQFSKYSFFANRMSNKEFVLNINLWKSDFS